MPRRRLYFGWWSVLALSITETVSFGILYYAYTVFVAPMARDLDASIAAVAGAYSLGLIVSGISAEWVGRWLDRHGARALMSAGSILAALMLWAWSGVQSLTGLYLVWFVMGFALAAVLYEPAFAVLAVWFERRRSLALTILTFVAGLASVIFIPLAGWLVEGLGWRQALVALAAILLAVTLPLHLTLLRRRPQDIGEQVDGGEMGSTSEARAPHTPTPSVEAADAVRSPAFALLTISFTASMMSLVALGVHLVPLLEARGLSALEAAGIGGLIGVAAMPGRLIFTPLGSWISRHAVTAAIFAAQLLGLLALLWIPDRWGITLFVVLFGVGFGAITPARAALVVETFGARAYGAISGRMSLIGTAARAAAPVVVGGMLQQNASGEVALGFLAALTLIAAVSVQAAAWARNDRARRAGASAR